MDIVCATDHGFIMPTGIMMKSLLVNNQDVDDISFHIIIDGSVAQEHKDIIRDIAQHHHANVTFYLFSEHKVQQFPRGPQNTHVTLATYYRLYLTDILPASLDKVLYLDGDMIIRRSLQSLWHTNIDHVACAWAPDQSEADINNFNRLHYPVEKGYFNAGVMLINLLYWRANGMQAKFLSYIREAYDHIIYHDQDVLNHVMAMGNSAVALPIKYNLQSFELFQMKYLEIDYWKYERELKEARHDPVIVHFTSNTKPWTNTPEALDHPFVNDFLKYKNMTIWKDLPLQEKSHTSWKGNLLRKLRILPPLAYINKYATDNA